jgi:hypothetical protein
MAVFCFVECTGERSAANGNSAGIIELIVDRNPKLDEMLKPVGPALRKISECIAMLDPNSTATIDPDFAADVDAVIEMHREPLEPIDWD